MTSSFSDPNALTPGRSREDLSREVQSLLWLAAGAAWALVAVKSWSQARRLDARRRTQVVSNRLLRQVFPDGIRS